MSNFATYFVGHLKAALDTQQQAALTFPVLATPEIDPRLSGALAGMIAQSSSHQRRVAAVLEILYVKPEGQACWVTTALLRQAWEATTTGTDPSAATQACAAAVLALKRHEVTRYEILVRWADQCALDEAVIHLRRNLAETLVQADTIAGFAFIPTALPTLISDNSRPLH